MSRMVKRKKGGTLPQEREKKLMAAPLIEGQLKIRANPWNEKLEPQPEWSGGYKLLGKDNLK